MLKLLFMYSLISSGESWLYEDDGRSMDYVSGKTANTSVSFHVDTDK